MGLPWTYGGRLVYGGLMLVVWTYDGLMVKLCPSYGRHLADTRATWGCSTESKCSRLFIHLETMV